MQRVELLINGLALDSDAYTGHVANLPTRGDFHLGKVKPGTAPDYAGYAGYGRVFATDVAAFLRREGDGKGLFVATASPFG